MKIWISCLPMVGTNSLLRLTKVIALLGNVCYNTIDSENEVFFIKIQMCAEARGGR